MARRRWFLLVALASLIVNACGSDSSCDTTIDGTEPTLVGTIRGELVFIEAINSVINEDSERYDVRIRTDDNELVNVTLWGRGDLLDIGAVYELDLYRSDGLNRLEQSEAWLLEKNPCGRSRTTVRGIDAEGIVFDLESPSLFDRVIPYREIFVGFGVFALAVAVLGRER